MRTVILQSYRTDNIPAWIASCLASARQWARIAGFDYEFVDDSFFDYAPAWVRVHRVQHMYPVTDIARLYLLRDRLNHGFERAVWLDADIIVFDPERFRVDTQAGYAFAHEIVPLLDRSGRVHLTGPSINNSVIVMQKGCPTLDNYISAAEDILRRRPIEKWSRMMIGPDFLRTLAKTKPIERLMQVGLFTPPLLSDIAAGGGELSRQYRQRFGNAMAAANLCHFLRSNASLEKRRRLDRLFERAIARLSESHGDVINRFGD